MKKLTVIILASVAFSCNDDDPEPTICDEIYEEAVEAGQYARSVQGTEEYDSAFAAYIDLRREYSRHCLQ